MALPLRAMRPLQLYSGALAASLVIRLELADVSLVENVDSLSTPGKLTVSPTLVAQREDGRLDLSVADSAVHDLQEVLAFRLQQLLLLRFVHLTTRVQLTLAIVQ